MNRTVNSKEEQIYDSYSFPPKIADYLEKWLRQNIEAEQDKYATELDGLRREKDKLERQRKKLLEAHYNDAIPLDLLKSEQQKIAKQLAAIDHQIKAYDYTFTTVIERLGDAIDLIENCGRTYRMANDNMKKMMNQAIFKRLLIGSDGKVTAEFAEPFTMLVEPMKDEVAQYNSVNNAEAREHLLTSFLSSIPNRLSNFFGKGWSKDFLVEHTGFEPVASTMRMLRAPNCANAPYR